MPREIGIFSAVILFVINIMVFYLHDTLSKVYEEKLSAKNKFLTGISHEMRTPVSVIMSISETQLRREKMSNRAEQSFTNVYNAANVLLSVVNDILEVSQTEETQPLALKSRVEKLKLINSTAIEGLDFECKKFSGGKILVVDDIEINLFIAEAMLEPFGVDIELCESGQQAIDKIREGNEYDIIFMDYMMPEMDGLDATKILRNLGYRRPIIALTANALKGLDETLLSNGFSGFMLKPIDTKILNSYLKLYVGLQGI
jgi:CheY-like chemotaxis protein